VSLLKLEEIHTYIGKSYVLQGVSIEVQPGEIVALLGRNGAGKTTTMNTIVGLVQPRSGRIVFRGEDITRLPAYQVARLGMAYVPQGRHLFPKMTVFENLKTGLRTKKNIGELEGVFDLFPVLKERLKQQAGTLSGGEQQALAIARALLTKPSLLLLDEPTTGLMPIIVAKLKEIITRINAGGMSILLVEEQVPFALSLAERIYFMGKGCIAHCDHCEGLKGRKDIFIRHLGVEAG